MSIKETGKMIWYMDKVNTLLMEIKLFIKVNLTNLKNKAMAKFKSMMLIECTLIQENGKMICFKGKVS